MKQLAQQIYNLLGTHITDSQLAALEQYERELLVWNKRINLTAIEDPEQVRVKHFLDSLSCLLVMTEKAMKDVIDVGTGAGFPGIPIKIICPSLNLTLVESVGKKVEFLSHIVQLLNLECVEILQERVESLGQSAQHRENYDWALARAVASMPTLVEYLLPMVRVGGGMLSMKGENAPAEAHSAESAIQLLGGHLHRLVPVALPGVAEERYLIVAEKIAATPARYPRRVGVPSKRPITHSPTATPPK